MRLRRIHPFSPATSQGLAIKVGHQLRLEKTVPLGEREDVWAI